MRFAAARRRTTRPTGCRPYSRWCISSSTRATWPARAGPQRRDLAREGLELARQLARLHAGRARGGRAGRAARAARGPGGRPLRRPRAGSSCSSRPGPPLWDRRLIEPAVRPAGGGGGARPARPVPGAGRASPPSTPWPRRSRPPTGPSSGELYDLLLGLQPAPVVRLNRAVATRYAHGPAAALAELDAVGRSCAVPAAARHPGRAAAALGRDDEADAATRRALALATNPAERELLRPGGSAIR